MIHESWSFLKELWNEDIETLINESLKFIGESAHISKGTTFEQACLHIQSLLDRPQQEQGYSYKEFLDVILKDEKSKLSSYATSVDAKEDEYLIHIWNSIYSKLKAPLESFKFLELNNPNEFCKYYPYALIGLMGIKRKWFARYNDAFLPRFEKNEMWEKMLKNWLNEGIFSRMRTKLRKKRVNSRRLMPLTVLLIMLRREYNLCNQCLNEYLDIRFSNSGTDADKSKYERCILGLFEGSGIQSFELKKEILKTDYVRFHPKLASLLIKQGAFNELYEKYAIICHPNIYQNYKEYKDDRIIVKGQKVLWYAYLFPYNRASENDYFIPKQSSTSQLIDKVFLSINGVNYQDHYLMPDKDKNMSFFDIIVLYEEKERRLLENYYDDYLSTGGSYLFIKSSDRQLYVQYKEEFEAFSEVTGGENFFLKILNMSKNRDIDIVNVMYLDCRSKVEECYKELQKINIIPPGVKFSGLATFLEGNNPRYELLKKDLMLKTLRFTLDFFLKMSNDVEHIGDDLHLGTKKYVEETKDINLLRALTFIISDILLWYKDVTKKYKGNEGIWKEREPIEGIVEKDDKGRYHVKNCEVKSKKLEYYKEKGEIEIKSYCEHIIYKKTGKGYKYYADLDNQRNEYQD